MIFRKSVAAIVAAGMLVAAGGVAMAQVPKGNGSGQHGTGAGPDPVTTGAPGAPDAGNGMAPAADDAMMAKPMKKQMGKKHMKKKHMAKKKMMEKSM